jgi:hypothetical protein
MNEKSKETRAESIKISALKYCYFLVEPAQKRIGFEKKAAK